MSRGWRLEALEEGKKAGQQVCMAGGGGEDVAAWGQVEPGQEASVWMRG